MSGLDNGPGNNNGENQCGVADGDGAGRTLIIHPSLKAAASSAIEAVAVPAGAVAAA